jgi:hypothetical protein
VDAILVELFLWLLQLVIEVLFYGGLEILAEIGLSSSRKEAPSRPGDGWFFVVVGLFVIGAIVGLLSLLVWPDRVVSRGPVPGLSLVVAPAAVGGVMHFWGRYRASRGHVITTLATFAGGASVGLGTAVVRFLGAR